MYTCTHTLLLLPVYKVHTQYYGCTSTQYYVYTSTHTMLRVYTHNTHCYYYYYYHLYTSTHTILTCHGEEVGQGGGVHALDEVELIVDDEADVDGGQQQRQRHGHDGQPRRQHEGAHHMALLLSQPLAHGQDARPAAAAAAAAAHRGLSVGESFTPWE